MDLRSRRRAVRIARARFTYASQHALTAVRQSASWLRESREYTNFTYDLEARNLEHLAWWAAAVTGAPVGQCRQWVEEISADEELRQVLRRATEERSGEPGFDPAIRYGRRVGWYVCVRALGPSLVVETGVEKGLGTMVLAAALRRNAAEGRPGRLTAIDIDPQAGALLRAPYAALVDLVISDSGDALRGIVGIDLFVHDSDHSAEHEASEYRLLEEGRLAAGAVVLSDNAHATTELALFAERTGRRFLFFDERPSGHWYRGAGIGAAFPA